MISQTLRRPPSFPPFTPRILSSLRTALTAPSPPTVARTCNLIFIVLDVLKPLGDKAIIENELEGFGIRLNKTPPNITLKKKDKGGIAISHTVPLTKIDTDEVKVRFLVSTEGEGEEERSKC